MRALNAPFSLERNNVAADFTETVNQREGKKKHENCSINGEVVFVNEIRKYVSGESRLVDFFSI